MKSKEWSTSEINFVRREYAKGHGRKSIAKMFKSKFGYERKVDSIKHCIDSHCIDIDKPEFIPKVLILDIETKYITTVGFGLYDQNFSLDQVLDDGGIFCWAAKWLGEDTVYYKDYKGDMKKEKQLLQPLWKMMDEADIIISQNGISFDIPVLFGKFMEHDMGSPSPFKQLDTLRMTKRRTKLLSNKLEYLTKKFCNLKKSTHKKFPGISLWLECAKGNKEAWKEMETYNKVDVKSTEEYFLKIAQYDFTPTTVSALKSYKLKKRIK